MCWRMSCNLGKIVASPTSQLILEAFGRFTYVTAHSTTLPLLHLRHSSFFNSSFASLRQKLILQLFRHFTYVTAHSTALPLFHLCHRHFTYVTDHSNPYIASPTSQLNLQRFHRFTHVTAHSTAVPLFNLRHGHFTYVTAHSPTLQPLHLRHRSFYNRFRCFTNVTDTSRTSPGESPMHRGMKNQSVVD